MADKIFSNVRLGLKIDTLENWGKSTLILKKGEVAFATVAASAGAGLSEPVIMMKVGDGDHTFSELNFDFYAKASDVLAAAKSEEALTAFVNGVIAKAGIATDEAMQTLAGKVTTAEGKITGLENELNTAETGLKARMTTAEGAIDALEGLVGDKKVATQISEAITALDLANTYEAKGEAAKVQTALDTYKTANDAAVQKNATDIAGEISRAKAAEEANAGAITAIKDGTTIDSFADVEAALAGKQATGDYATKAEAQAMADGKDAAIAEAKKAGTDAAAAAAAAQADADALEALVGDTKVSEQISGAIEDLDLANTYAAKVHTHVKADITDFAHTHEIAEVNGLQGALDGKQAAGNYATKDEAKGYADAKDEAIATAQKAGDDAQADVDALETYVGTIPEGYTEETVIAYIDKKAAEAVETAGTGSSSVLGQLNQYKTDNDARVEAVEGEVDALQGLVGDKKVSEAIAAAVKAEEDRAKGIEGGLETRLAAVEGDYLKAADKEALQIQINTIMNNPDAEGAINSINEFTQYVKDHGTIADGFRTDIDKNKEDITGLGTRVGAAETAIGTKAAQADLEALAGRVTTVEGDLNTETTGLKARVGAAESAIDVLEEKVGDKKVSEQITDVTNPLAARVVELEKVDHDHANKAELDLIVSGDKAKWDAKLEDVTAAAESGLKATKTGNTVAIEIDDSIVWVFDCGDAGVTA
jgi:hypothetical protein